MKEAFREIVIMLQKCAGISARDIYESNTKDSKDFYDGAYYGFSKAIQIVKQVAEEFGTDTNVRSNDGWIPVSERLPNKEEFLKDDGRFIVTDGNRRYQSIYDIYAGVFRTLVTQTLFGKYSFEQDNLAIAWQPLPQVYKPQGE